VGAPEARWLASVARLGWPMNRPEVDDRSRLLRLSWIASQNTGLMGGLCGVRFRHGQYLGPGSAAAACWLERRPAGFAQDRRVAITSHVGGWRRDQMGIHVMQQSSDG
jgi:hypothetical protein